MNMKVRKKIVRIIPVFIKSEGVVITTVLIVALTVALSMCKNFDVACSFYIVQKN